MNLQTAPAYAAEVRSSFRVSSLQPRVPGELRGATGAKQDTWQPRPTCTFQTRCDKQCLATPMGVGDLRESQGLTHPGLQIAGDTPFQHPLGRGHTRPRNCASHVPCQPLGALGPARHTQPSGRAALCSRRRCLGTRLPRIGLTAASAVRGFTLLFAPGNRQLSGSLLQPSAVPGQRRRQAEPQLSWGSAFGSRTSDPCWSPSSAKPQL